MGPQMWRWSDVSGGLIRAQCCTVSVHYTVCAVARSRLLDKGGFASQICHEHFNEGWRAALSQFCKMTRPNPWRRFADTPLALHYLAGYSEAEIAETLGLSPATVKSRLREGREQAKQKLLPVVRELLALQTNPGCSCPLPQQTAELVMASYGTCGCRCHKTLTA
jgi:hypothetical protein